MRRGRWPPFALVTPLLSLLGLWQLWPLEGESLFVSWLGLPKTWALYPASFRTAIIHLCLPGGRAAFYAEELVPSS